MTFYKTHNLEKYKTLDPRMLKVWSHEIMTERKDPCAHLSISQ
jgi:hypothetical protein